MCSCSAAIGAGLGLVVSCILGAGCDNAAGSADAGSTDGGAVGLPANASTVIERPSGLAGNAIDRFGKWTAVALDEAGDPGVAYVHVDPDADNNADDTAVFFKAWDPATKAFGAEVQVAKLGAPNAGLNKPVSLAYDPASKTWVLVHQAALAAPNWKGGLQVSTSSDRGQTWKTATLTNGAVPGNEKQMGATNWPTVAARDGQAHVLYFHGGGGYVYATGPLSADPGSWTKTVAPFPTLDAGTAPGNNGNNRHPGLGLDADGKPGIAYWMPTSGKEIVLAWWQPASGVVKTIAKSSDENATADVYVGFAGSKPRVLFTGKVGALSGLMSGTYSIASDEGQNWSLPVPVPLESGAAAGLTWFGAVSASGKGIVAYASNGGDGSAKCGVLKTSRTTDFASWTTCSPDAANALKLRPAATSISLAYGPGDALSLVFTNTDAKGGAPAGVILWRL